MLQEGKRFMSLWDLSLCWLRYFSITGSQNNYHSCHSNLSQAWWTCLCLLLTFIFSLSLLMMGNKRFLNKSDFSILGVFLIVKIPTSNHINNLWSICSTLFFMYYYYYYWIIYLFNIIYNIYYFSVLFFFFSCDLYAPDHTDGVKNRELNKLVMTCFYIKCPNFDKSSPEEEESTT